MTAINSTGDAISEVGTTLFPAVEADWQIDQLTVENADFLIFGLAEKCGVVTPELGSSETDQASNVLLVSLSLRVSIPSTGTRRSSAQRLGPI
jgi:hypothetical protein